jgi:hypothetical protein
MNRLVAIGILVVFAFGALTLVFWGVTDLHLAIVAFRACGNVVIDSASYWFLGMISVALLPAIAFLPDLLHGKLFAIIIAVFFILPAIGALVINRTANAYGYDIDRVPDLFELREERLSAPSDCRTMQG